MAIITVSRGSFARGKAVAEQVAQNLGYECLSRDSIIDTMTESGASGAKMVKEMDDVPSFFRRFAFGKDSYTSYIQSVILDHFRKDNVVYHGFMGHVFVQDVPNILKARITSDITDRARIRMLKDGSTLDQAVQLVNKLDEERRQWSLHLYGIDPSDCRQYDLVLNVSQIPLETAIETVCSISRLEPFQLTSESRRRMEDLAVAAQIKNALLRSNANVEVSAQDGKVAVKTTVPMHRRKSLAAKIEELIATMPHVTEVNVQFSVSLPLSAFKVEEDLVIKPSD